MMQLNLSISTLQNNINFIKTHLATDQEVDISSLQKSLPDSNHQATVSESVVPSESQTLPSTTRTSTGNVITTKAAITSSASVGDDKEKKGLLFCNGKQTDSEVIYWKIVPGDSTYESPITPHHGMHHDR